jgi:hypothetical protein
MQLNLTAVSRHFLLQQCLKVAVVAIIVFDVINCIHRDINLASVKQACIQLDLGVGSCGRPALISLLKFSFVKKTTV